VGEKEEIISRQRLDTIKPGETNTPNTPLSIWDQPSFPHVTNAIKFTPAQLKDAIDEYTHKKGCFHTWCDTKGICYVTAMKVIDQYPEISTYYAHAQKIRVEHLIDSGEELADNVETTVEVRPGQFQQNTAAVRLTEAKLGHRRWQAERLSRKFAPKTITENLNANINLSGNIKIDENLSLSEIMAALHRDR
jgi:hypothetical protein